MTGYYCQTCRTYFDTPLRRREPPVFEGWPLLEYAAVCPECGEPYIEPTAACTNCAGGVRRRSDILCPDCRAELLDKFCDFADNLTAEEEEQLDAWLEDSSVTEREDWADV